MRAQPRCGRAGGWARVGGQSHTYALGFLGRLGSRSRLRRRSPPSPVPRWWCLCSRLPSLALPSPGAPPTRGADSLDGPPSMKAATCGQRRTHKWRRGMTNSLRSPLATFLSRLGMGSRRKVQRTCGLQHAIVGPPTPPAAKPPCVGGLNHTNHAPALQAGCVCGPKGCTPWG